MTRKEQIEQASVQYQLKKKPVAIAGAEWADVAYRMNINKDFVEGAEWADEHPKDEEPKNKDFEDFVKSYMSTNDDNILHYYDRYAGLVDGAQWQKEQMMFTRPLTPLRETVEVTTRLPHVDDDLKPIAEFIMDYSLWDLRKDEWNQPVIVVPLFRVLDALIQRGKPYCEGE